MCTVYAVEALQALASCGADAQQYLETSAADWGPLVWRLVLAEPEETSLLVSQAAYWVCIFGNNMFRRYSGSLHRCTEGLLRDLKHVRRCTTPACHGMLAAQ